MALRTPSVLGKMYSILGKDGLSRCACVYFLKYKSDVADALRKVLADVRAGCVPSKVEIVRSDNGGEFYGGILWWELWRGVQTALHQAGTHGR